MRSMESQKEITVVAWQVLDTEIGTLSLPTHHYLCSNFGVKDLLGNRLNSNILLDDCGEGK